MSILTTNGTFADVQANLYTAADGDVVQLPAGSFTWNTQMSNIRGLHIRGAGAGKVLARSRSTVAIGTGTKTFTLEKEEVASIAARRSAIVAGLTLRIWRAGGDIDTSGPFPGVSGSTPTPWVQGTVTSLIGDVLTVNITSTNHSGTHGVWVITTNAETQVTINIVPGSSCGLDFNLPGTGAPELSGIRFVGTQPNGTSIHLVLVRGEPNAPIWIHDCFFNQQAGSGIRFNINSGLVWDCDFCPLPGSPGYNSGIIIKENLAGRWMTPSTMGTADTTGKRNVYIEDCTFHFTIDVLECDDNARVVVRNSLFNNGGTGAHGVDTSEHGMRHVEIYRNHCVFDSIAGKSYPVQSWFGPRGGTGLFAFNTCEKIASPDWGNGADIQLQIQQLARSTAWEGGWGAGDGGVPQYPVPRQVGSGYINGTRLDGKGRPGAGDLEPFYIWGNTTAPYVGLSDGADGNVVDPDKAEDYIKLGRDYYNGTAKPGWTAYPYPHPARSGVVAPPPSPPTPPPSPPPTTTAPVFTAPLGVTVKRRQDITLTASASGASLAYAWSKGTTVLPGKTAATLTINNAQAADSGTYTITVTNPGGSVTTSTKLTVV